MAPYLAQYRVLDAAGRLFGHGRLVCRRTRMAEKGSRRRIIPRAQLAYWHQPTFSAADSLSQEGTTAQAFWQLLYEYGADVVLNGHDHLYARYRPLDPSGNSDPKKGIREFIVGTGGETLDPVVTTNTTAADPSGDPNFNAANLEAATGNYWGVMALTLDQNGYKWDFESALELPGAPAGTYSDKGVGTCHGPVNK